MYTFISTHYQLAAVSILSCCSTSFDSMSPPYFVLQVSGYRIVSYYLLVLVHLSLSSIIDQVVVEGPWHSLFIIKYLANQNIWYEHEKEFLLLLSSSFLQFFFCKFSKFEFVLVGIHEPYLTELLLIKLSGKILPVKVADLCVLLSLYKVFFMKNLIIEYEISKFRKVDSVKKCRFSTEFSPTFWFLLLLYKW